MAEVLSLENKKLEELELPAVFKEKIRPDIIKKAFLAEQSKGFQLKYVDPLAGKRKATVLMKTRRTFKTMYGHGMNRSPRKTMSRIGSHFSFVGAFAPHTVGGREAHPSTADKVLIKKINKKERQFAIRSAIAASAVINFVGKYHNLGGIKTLPIIVDDSINKINKTKEAASVLSKLGLQDELDRISKRKIRAGKGKLRGRRYKRKLGPLFVTTDDKKLKMALRNLNVSVKTPSNISVSDASHAGNPGRLIIWTKGALSSLKI